MARGYKLGHRSIKERKRNEANERQLAREARTTNEQLALIKTRRGESKREVARLMKVKKPKEKLTPSHA